MEFLRLRGIGVSPGIVQGEAVLAESVLFPVRKSYIPPHRVEDELVRLRNALAETRESLAALRREVGARIGEDHAFIFDAHLLILEDRVLMDGLERHIREENVNAETALGEMHEHYRKIFAAIEDEYFRERQSP